MKTKKTAPKQRLEQSSLDLDEYIVGLMKIAVESRKQLKEGE